MENVGILETELFKNLPSLARETDACQQVTLHIAANADSLATWFLTAAAAFTKTSDYLLKISTDDQEFTADWLARGGYWRRYKRRKADSRLQAPFPW